MTNIIKSTLLVLALFTSASAIEKLNQKEIKSLENLAIFQQAQIKIIDAYKSDDFYHVRANIRGQVNELYLTANKKHLIAGDIINTTNGSKITVPVDLKNTIGQEAFSYGTGKEELILFTDPECPYCKKFESYFPQIKDKVKIKIFFYPLDFHANAKDLSLYIMSKKTADQKAQALFDVTKDSSDFKNRSIDEKHLAELNTTLNKHIQLAQELGVRGTPALYDKNGNKVSWVELLMKNGIQVK
jgi:thiol:disulfide interchange protein DsbC